MKNVIKTILLLLVFLLAIASCEDNDSINKIKKSTKNPPLFVELTNVNEKENDYIEEYRYKNTTIYSSDIILTQKKFLKFKEEYNLSKYQRIIQVFLSSEINSTEKNLTLEKNDLNLILVYYTDDKLNVKLDIIKGNKILKTYKDISSISGSVVTTLVSKYDDFSNPFIIMIKNQSLFLEKDKLNWALFSDDKLFNEVKTILINNNLNERVDTQDGCWTCAGDNGSDCNMWNPGLCGNICQMRTSAKVVQDNQDTNTIGVNLFNLFPNLTSVKEIINDSKNNKHLADNFYNLGSFSFSNQMNVPFDLHLQFANILLTNSNKISLFIDPQSKSSNEILYTSIEAQEYLDFIPEVRTIMNGYDSNSNPRLLPQVKSDFNSFLSSFENAIVKYQNKALNEIHMSL